MKKPFKVLVTAALASVAILAGAYGALNAYGPSDEQLGADIQDLDKRLEAARSFGERFGEGSLLRVQNDLEVAFLRSTRAMLDQKRKAWLRGISLSYNAEIGTGRPGNPEAIRAIDSEIDDAQRKIKEADARAAQYTGGLLQITGILEAQTARVTEAVLRQKRALTEIGLGALAPSPTVPKSSTPIGRSKNDKDAL
jgi:hypothetical protein